MPTQEWWAAHPEKRGKAQKKWRDANPEKQRAATAAWNAANPGWMRNHHFEKKYGITLADVEAMLVAQGGKCAIDGRDITGIDARGRMLARVDHVHGTKIVRGLLCHSCNTAIGHLQDDPTVVMAAHDYLKAHQCQI